MTTRSLRPLGVIVLFAAACSFDASGLDSAAPPGGTSTTDASSSSGPVDTSTSTDPSSTDPTTSGASGSVTSGTTTTTDATTTAPPASCGDGKVDPGEECDDGAENGPGKACKGNCANNVCGDGDVGPGEGCDDGNAAGGDGCDAMCVLESCGDGQLQGSEQCDDGNQVDDDMCTNACTAPACGDGIIQQGSGEICDDGNTSPDDGCSGDCKPEACGDGVKQADEVCDDGNANEDDGCTSACALPKCGDGFVQPSKMEECDDGNMTDGDGCTNACTLNVKRVFVTSMEYNGNLGGIAGADMKCQMAAMSAGLPGMYMAWVTDGDVGGTHPAMRFPTKANVPYVLPNNTKVADDWNDLTDGSLDAAINVTEAGAAANGEVNVWTNTTSGGNKEGMVDCTSWGNTNQSGHYGVMTATDGTWSDTNNTTGCTNTHRLYCFQQ